MFNFADNGFNVFQLAVNEHTGTHIDAPLHFSADGNSVDEIPVENLVAPLCVIDIAARAQDDPDTRLTPEDIKAWIAANGDIPDNACVAMNSGWAAKVDTDAFRGFDGEAMHYPGFHIDATNMLLEETGANSGSGPINPPSDERPLCRWVGWLCQRTVRYEFDRVTPPFIRSPCSLMPCKCAPVSAPPKCRQASFSIRSFRGSRAQIRGHSRPRPIFWE